MPTRVDQTTPASPVTQQATDSPVPTDDRARHAEQVDRIGSAIDMDQIVSAASQSALDARAAQTPAIQPGRSDGIRGQQLGITRPTLDVGQLRDRAVQALVGKYDAAPTQFHAGMAKIYGDGYDAAKMDALIASLRSGDLAAFDINVQLADAAALGQHDAAFTQQGGGTILLSEQLLRRPSQLQRVFNEEFLGHGLTAQISGRPWSTTQLGDEGEALARWLAGGELDAILAETQGQRDIGWITINIDGTQQRVQARLYTDMSRRWEIRGAHQPEHWRDLATKKFEPTIDRALLARYADKQLKDSTAITTIEHLKTYLDEQKLSEPRAGAVADVRALLETFRGEESDGGARLWKPELEQAWAKAIEAMEGDPEGKPITEAEAALFRELAGSDMSNGARKLLREIVGERIPDLLAPSGTGDAADEVRALLETAQSDGSAGAGRIWKKEIEAAWLRAAETVGERNPGKPITEAEAQLFHGLLGADLSGGARRLLRQIVEERIPTLLAPPAASMQTYDEIRAAVSRDLLGDDPTVAIDALGRQLASEALAATMLIKLKKAKLVGEDVTLTTELSPQELAAIGKEAGIADGEVSTWGDLLVALTVDADSNDRRDVDAFVLQRLLIGKSQQEILRALTAIIPYVEMAEALRGVDYTGEIPRAARSSLELMPPKGFGLAGHTAIEKMQQQLLLRTGAIFRDVNEDGVVDDDDTVHHLAADGSLTEVRYGDLDEDLKKAVRLNLIMAEVVDKYATGNSHIKFPHYNSSTRESDPERVNEAFWKVDELSTGSTSWVLGTDALPSAAVADALIGNGSMYTTECAHARSIMRLHALSIYYQTEYGSGEGTFRFNALFVKDGQNRMSAGGYLTQWEKFKKANPDKDWAAFAAENEAPKIEYALVVSRHNILDANEDRLRVWQRSDSESAAGTTGYFHNRSVSPLGVKIGYIGENVIDMGYLNGTRRYWGHPGGIKAEPRWQAELGSPRIAVKQLSEFSQYFDAAGLRHNLGKHLERLDKRSDKQIAELRSNKPAGWEERVEKLEEDKAWMTALFAVRQTFADSFDPAKLDAAKAEFKASNGYDEPAAMQVIIETLTESGRRALTQAFDKLPEAKQKTYLAQFDQAEIKELTAEQKAQAALFETYVLNGNRIHPTLLNEALHALTSASVSEWFGGHLTSRTAFGAWLQTDAFKTWYQEKAGKEFTGDTDLAKLSTDAIQEIVQLAIPATRDMKTAYGQMSADITVGRQMAILIKEGKLPAAEFGGEPSIGPID